MQLHREVEEAKIVKVNPRKEVHGNDRVTSADVKLEFTTGADIIAPLVAKRDEDKDMFDDKEIEEVARHLFDADGRPLLHQVKHIELDTELEDHTVTLNNKLRLTETKINKIRITPRGGRQVDVLMRVQCHPSQEQIGKLCDWTREIVTLDIQPPAKTEEPPMAANG